MESKKWKKTETGRDRLDETAGAVTGEGGDLLQSCPDCPVTKVRSRERKSQSLLLPGPCAAEGSSCPLGQC